jgi:hypothetical protein
MIRVVNILVSLYVYSYIGLFPYLLTQTLCQKIYIYDYVKIVLYSAGIEVANENVDIESLITKKHKTNELVQILVSVPSLH